MNYKISDDRKRLTIFVTPEEQKELRDIEQCGGDCQCDVSMHDFLEPLTRNSELEWIPEGSTGDLTSAPMLGILGDDYEHAKLPHSRYGEILVGSWGEPVQCMYKPVLERWAFMDYQVRSVLEELRDKGEVTFVSGGIDDHDTRTAREEEEIETARAEGRY